MYSLGLSQGKRSTYRFFTAIRPSFLYNNIKAFDQDLLEKIQSKDMKRLVAVGPRASQRLFRDSQMFAPGDSGVFYYAYNDTYGNFYQIILAIPGLYGPSLILMNYSDTGQLLAEINLVGSFIDGGDYFVWNSEFTNDANLRLTHNAYSERFSSQAKETNYFNDSTITTHVVRADGLILEAAQENYKVKTASVRGMQEEVLSENRSRRKVFAPSGLKLRQSLQRRAKTSVVPYGAEVEVLHATPDSYFIDWVRGNWVFVRYDTLEGYMFDGYLSDLALPEIDEPEDCEQGYAELLKSYVSKNYKALSQLDSVAYEDGPYDSLYTRYKLRQLLTDSTYWVVFPDVEMSSYEIELPETHLEEAYVLLQAILCACSDADSLKDEILFVKNRHNRIYKIYDKAGRVFISEGDNRRMRLRMSTLPPKKEGEIKVE